MKLSEQRTRLRGYIYSQSYRNILTAIATKELSSIYKISKNEAPLTESDISNYIRDNFDHLNSETNKESNTITECADGIVASIFVLLLLSFSTYYYFKNK